jgi:hypothetical protein
MRTVKVELLNTTNTKNDSQRGSGLQSEVASAVFDDYRTLYGPLNFEDYLEDFLNNRETLSFLGLWVKAVRFGVIMSNVTQREFGELLGGSEIGRVFDSIPEELRRQLNRKKWLAWYPKGIRSRSTPDSRRRALADVFDDSTKPDPAVMTAWEAGEQKVKQGAPAVMLGRPDFKNSLFGIPEQPPEAEQTAVKSKNWQWAIDPAFPVPAASLSVTKALDEVDGYWRERFAGDEKKVKSFLAIGDAGNHLNNGLLGDFFCSVRDTDPTDLAAQLATAFGFSKAETGVVATRLAELQTYAKALPIRPRLTANWADYRSDMTAKLESWYSNRTGKGREAISAIWGKIDPNTGEIKNGGLLEKLKELQVDPELDPVIAEGVVVDIISFIGERRDTVDRVFSDGLQNYLAVLRDELNRYFQARSDEWESHQPQVASRGRSKGHQQEADNPWRKKGDYYIGEKGVIPRKVQSSPLFWGEDKLALWGKVVNLKQNIAEKIATLEAELAEVTASLDATGGIVVGGELKAPAAGNKQVDQLAALAVRMMEAPANGVVMERLRALESELGVTFAERQKRCRFYKTGREHSEVKLLGTTMRNITVARLLELADLGSLYTAAKQHPEQDWLLRDTIQLSKVVLSIAVHTLNSAPGNSREDRQREIALTGIHSDAQGMAFLLARTEFVSRATVQAINGNQNLLAYDDSGSAPRYYYTFPKLITDQPSYAGTLFSAGEGNIGTKEAFHDRGRQLPKRRGKNAAPEPFHALAVVSSRYQTQFFNWFLGRDSRKQSTLKAGGSFTIAEKIIKLDWSGKHPAIKSVGVSRVFVSQPFTIMPRELERPPRDGRRFLGADIGEYGLAWSVWRFDVDSADKKEHLASGFMAEGGHRLIRATVNKRREGQAMRTFTSPDTYTARLREDVVASYQAQLEALAVSFDAQLVFEREVSVFETGSNRVKAIYDALKRSSVLGATDAEKADTKQHWGDIEQSVGEAKRSDQRIPWASPVSAWMTSQTCSACGRAYVRAYRGGQGNDADPECAGEVRWFDKEAKSIRTRHIAPDTQWSTDVERRSFERGVYAAMRPALHMPDGTVMAGAQVLYDKLQCDGTLDDAKGFGSLTLTSKAELQEYEHKRGKSAIFICPYTDCGHIADADLQASYNIALRGYAWHEVTRRHPEWRGKKTEAVKKGLQEEADAILREFRPRS